jgi:hypothetical protein
MNTNETVKTQSHWRTRLAEFIFKTPITGATVTRNNTTTAKRNKTRRIITM